MTGFTNLAVFFSQGEELVVLIDGIKSNLHLTLLRPPLSLIIVDLHDVLGQLAVPLGVWLVDKEEDEVEPGKNGIGDLGIVLEGLGLVVAAVDRIGGSYHAHPALQLADDSRLGYRHGLLLHGLQQGGGIADLVELVNGANAVIGQDQGSRLERLFVVVPIDGHCEPAGGSGGRIDVDAVGQDFSCEFEEL